MDHKGLLFIPDISGFSRFVTETEIGHSRLIIQELLEILISANELGLEISEIEGDAILFYKFGDPPSLETLYKQVEKMFCSFHENLLAYELHRYCQCKACMSAKALTLKVITHYGEFTGYTVRNFQKLIGKDIIVAHQLLKNDIPDHEYWIITRNVSERPSGLTQWMRWDTSVKQTETGPIPFHYTQLGKLRHELRPAASPPSALEKMTKVFSVSKEYDTDIITLFHASGDFHYRSKWQEGVGSVEIMNHYLPRVGMKCKCIIDGREAIIYSSSYRYQEDHIEFTETLCTPSPTTSPLGAGSMNPTSLTWFKLEHIPTTPNLRRTRLTLDYYADRNIASGLVFKLLRKTAIERQFRRSLENLVPVVSELRVPSAV
jgi:hypothetical protein